MTASFAFFTVAINIRYNLRIVHLGFFDVLAFKALKRDYEKKLHF